MTYGLYGWYWECPNGNMGVVITKARIMEKFFPKPDFTHVKGDEYTVYLTKERFTEMKLTKMLKVDKKRQIALEAFHNKKYAPDEVPAPEVQQLG